MKRIYSSLNSLLVDNLYNVLQQEDVPCEIRNRHGSSMMGEIPVSEAFTELWVEEDHAERANVLIAEALSEDDKTQGASWKCPTCGTEIEGNFDTCWKCAPESGNRERRDDDEPIFESVEEVVPGSTTRYVVWTLLALLGLWWLSSR